MKLSSDSVLLGTLAFVSVALICFSGIALEYGWFQGEVEETVVEIAHGNATSESHLPSRFNINTATVSQLQFLPGMDETLATRVVLFCQQNGPITESTQLLAVEGMDEEKLLFILPFLTFE